MKRSDAPSVRHWGARNPELIPGSESEQLVAAFAAQPGMQIKAHRADLCPVPYSLLNEICPAYTEAAA